MGLTLLYTYLRMTKRIESGFLLYCLLLYFLLVKTKSDSVVTACSQSVLITVFIFGLFSFPGRIFSFQLVSVMAVAFLLACREQNNLELLLLLRVQPAGIKAGWVVFSGVPLPLPSIQVNVSPPCR